MPVNKNVLLTMVEQFGTGGLPETKSLGSEIYGEIDLEPLEGLAAVRKTSARLEQWDVEFEGKTILDVGCHIGSLCFGLLEHNPAKVVGVDTNSDRINTANEIKSYNSLGEQVEFRTDYPPDAFDIVLCCSVDDYVLDKCEFYASLINTAQELLLFESNVQVYDNHPFAEFCIANELEYQWIGEAVDKYPFGANRTRNLFRVWK